MTFITKMIARDPVSFSLVEGEFNRVSLLSFFFFVGKVSVHFSLHDADCSNTM